MDTHNTTPSIILLFIAGTLVFVFIDIFRTGYSWLPAYLLPMLLLLLIVTRDMGDIYPVKRGNLFVTASGMVGTVIGSPMAEHGRQVTYRVAFKRGDVPKSIRRETDGWAAVVLDKFTGTVTIPVTASRDLFVTSPVEDIENTKVHTLVHYHGRLDKAEIRHGKDALLLEKLRTQTSVIGYVSTQVRELEKTLAQLSHLKTLDMNEMSQWFQKLSDRVKNIKIITKRGGSDIESIGGEIGSS